LLDADRKCWRYLLAKDLVLKNGSRDSGNWMNFTRKGGTTLPTALYTVVPVFPAEVALVDPGIETRYRALVRQIKAHPAYNETIGIMLGIVASKAAGPDFDTLAPVLTATVKIDRVEIGWTWQGHSDVLDMIEIQVNRGSGYKPLCFDTTPGYTDNEPFPASLTCWSYRAVYRKGDQTVGLWSPEISVKVGG
jgi:hypothetical protein